MDFLLDFEHLRVSTGFRLLRFVFPTNDLGIDSSAEYVSHPDDRDTSSRGYRSYGFCVLLLTSTLCTDFS